MKRIAKLYLTLITAPLIVILIVRLIMTPAFVYFEYNRDGFPDDEYGMTTAERIEYAPYALRYLLNGEDIDYLGNLSFPDNRELFTLRELRHMRDVKLVTQVAFAGAILAGIIALGAIFILRRDLLQLAAGLRHGAILTVGLLITIALLSIFSWDFFFTGFHQLFFEGGTWQFYYSDTLIRLFPEQFWFDAALTIGGLTILSAITLYFITNRVKSP